MFCLCTWHVQIYFPRLSSVTVTSRSEWRCLVCLWGGCSQLQGRGDSWTHGNRRCNPLETRSSLMDGLQRPGGDNKQFDNRETDIKRINRETMCSYYITYKIRYTYPLLYHTFSRHHLSYPLDQAWVHTKRSHTSVSGFSTETTFLGACFSKYLF